MLQKIRTEPVMVSVILVAIVQAVCTYLADGGALTLTALLPIVAGAIARSLVFPANGETLSHPQV